MKLIVAIVQPFKAQEIADVLGREPGFPGMTVLDARGFGRDRPPADAREAQGLDTLHPHRVVLVGAPDHVAERIADRIRQVAHTGLKGDGKVFILEMQAVLAIGSDDRDDGALE